MVYLYMRFFILGRLGTRLIGYDPALPPSTTRMCQPSPQNEANLIDSSIAVYQYFTKKQNDAIFPFIPVVCPRPFSSVSPRWRRQRVVIACAILEGRLDFSKSPSTKVQPPPPRGLVGLAEKSKVQPPPCWRGSLGNLKTSKVHGGGDQVEGGGCYKVTFV